MRGRGTVSEHRRGTRHRRPVPRVRRSFANEADALPRAHAHGLHTLLPSPEHLRMPCTLCFLALSTCARLANSVFQDPRGMRWASALGTAIQTRVQLRNMSQG